MAPEYAAWPDLAGLLAVIDAGGGPCAQRDPEGRGGSCGGAREVESGRAT